MKAFRFEDDIEAQTKAIRMYKNPEYLIPEIANIVGWSNSMLTKFYRKCFLDGRLIPRNENSALHHRTPNGHGKPKYVKIGRKTPKSKKFTDADELQIAKEYYELGFSSKEIMQRWNCHPMQLQAIRKKLGGNYAPKKMGIYANKENKI